MAALVRIFLALGFLLAHTPVCKGALLSPRTQTDTPRPIERPPCCAKCAKQVEPTHNQPQKPRTPAKPICPTGAECVLCGAPAAVAPAVGVIEFVTPPVARLAEFEQVLAADGFRTLLDRPPRR